MPLQCVQPVPPMASNPACHAAHSAASSDALASVHPPLIVREGGCGVDADACSLLIVHERKLLSSFAISGLLFSDAE